MKAPVDGRGFFEEASKRLAARKYDVSDLRRHLAEKTSSKRWNSTEVGLFWRSWAEDVRASRKPGLLDLYVNVPVVGADVEFQNCRRECPICRQRAQALRSQSQILSYLEGLRLQARHFSGLLKGIKARSLAIGGETPGALGAKQLDSLLHAVFSSFRFHGEGERSVACPPALLTEEKLAVLRRNGINRIRMGAPSLGREAPAAGNRDDQDGSRIPGLIRRIRELGFERGAAVDLILGWVGDDSRSFIGTFSEMLKQSPEVISIIMVRPPSPFHLRSHDSGNREASYSCCRKMAAAVAGPVERIAQEAGYVRRGAPDREWIFLRESRPAEETTPPVSLLGLGWNARSRVSGLCSYLQTELFQEEEGFDPDEPLYEGARLDDRDEMLDCLINALRKNTELSLADFRDWFGKDLLEKFGGALRALKRRGSIRIDGGILRLQAKDPRERLLCGMRLAGKDAVERVCAEVLPGESPSPAETPGGPERTGNLELNVGKVCNNRCIFCMNGAEHSAKRRWLPAARARDDIRRFYGTGCRSLGFLGGEPTAYPRLLECVRYAKSLGYERIALCSNGMKFGEPSFVEALLEAGVTRFTVSIHSHLAEMEDRLTRVPGNFERKLRGVRLLLAEKARGRVPHNVSLNPVLNKKTLPGIPAYIEFFKGLGIDDIRFNYIWPQYQAERDKDMIPTFRESMPEILKIVLLNERRLKMHLGFGGIPRCMFRWAGGSLSKRLESYLAQKYLGECEDLPTQVSMDRERFNWQERKRNLLKTHREECRRCRYYSVCDGVWKTYAALYGLGELVPVEP